MATGESIRGRTIIPLLLVIFVGLCLYTGRTGEALAGYRLDCAWDPDSSIVTWSVSVESGSPEPFKDFHVSVGDGKSGSYEMIAAPPGWEMRVMRLTSYTPKLWLGFYGNYGVNEAMFRFRYTVLGDTTSGRQWRLTDDGNADPRTGVIEGEGGINAVVPYRRGVNRTTKAAVHVLPHSDTRTCLRNFPSVAGCQDIITTCADNDVDFFPVFYDLEEYYMVEYSVSWPGTYSCAFNSCTWFTMGTITWPAGYGDPAVHTDCIGHIWDQCQQEPAAIPGWGWLYESAPSMICLVPHTKTHSIRIFDCDSGPNWPRCNACAGFAGATGGVTCGASRTEGRTWSEIKAMFE